MRTKPHAEVYALAFCTSFSAKCNAISPMQLHGSVRVRTITVVARTRIVFRAFPSFVLKCTRKVWKIRKRNGAVYVSPWRNCWHCFFQWYAFFFIRIAGNWHANVSCAGHYDFAEWDTATSANIRNDILFYICFVDRVCAYLFRLTTLTKKSPIF